MRILIVALMLAMLALAGCTDAADPETTDSDGDGFTDADEEEAGTDPEDPDDTPQDDTEEPEPDIQTEFSFGPGGGCTGDTAVGITCASFHAGPDDAPTEAADGYWIGLTDGYAGVSFTSTVENQRGDTDCVYTDDELEVTGDASNGAGPCGGKVPSDAAYLFIFSYAEPHQGITVTFEP